MSKGSQKVQCAICGATNETRWAVEGSAGPGKAMAQIMAARAVQAGGEWLAEHARTVHAPVTQFPGGAA